MGEVFVLLPTKNEEGALSEVIDRVPIEEISSYGFSTSVIVVDGFSTDSTCEIARAKKVELIEQTGKGGKGIGVRQALEKIFLRASDEDILVMLDADGTYRPEDITRFVESLKKHDVAWGSRLKGRIEKGAMSKTNWLGNVLLSLLASITYMRRTTDLCTGFWGFKIGSLRKMPLTAEGFNLEADLFSSVCKCRLYSEELVIDYEHREGESNLRWYYDGPRIFSMILRKRFTRK